MSSAHRQHATQTSFKSSKDHSTKINNSTLTLCGFKRKVSSQEGLKTYPQQRRRVSSDPTDLLNTYSYSVRAKSEPLTTVKSFVNFIPKRKAGDLNLSIPSNNKKIKSSGDYSPIINPFISRANAPIPKKDVGNLLPNTSEKKKDLKSVSCDVNHFRKLLNKKKHAVSPLMRKACSHLGCVAAVRKVGGEGSSVEAVTVDKGKGKVRVEDEEVEKLGVKDGEDGSEEGVLTEEDIEAAELMNAVSGLPEYYKLVSKIGEGSFGAVYKAKDMRHDLYDNESWKSLLPEQEGEEQFVALKRVFNTSNPQKVAKEIRFLYTLRGSACVAPIITAFRKEDETFIVMPCLKGDDFVSSYNQMTMVEIKGYFKSLFTALDSVHKNDIIHRDVKTDNFLFDREANTGFLIDFGLADDVDRGRRIEEHYNKRKQSLAARHSQAAAAERIPYKFVGGSTTSSGATSSSRRPQLGGLVRNDARHDIVANCAGTRGYQAPEVLMMVPRQTTAIDIWSAGIIMADIVTGRYPFFYSTRPEDTIIELMQIFGKKQVEQCARINGRTLSTNIDLPDQALDWADIAEAFNEEKVNQWDRRDFYNLTDLLDKCLRLNPYTRITAEAALNHPFFR